MKISTNIRLQFKYKATTTNWRRHTVHVHTIYSDTCTIVWTHVIIPDHKHKFVLKFLNSGNHDNLVNYTIFPLSSNTCTKYIWPCNHCHIYITLKQTFTKKLHNFILFCYYMWASLLSYNLYYMTLIFISLHSAFHIN